MKLREEVVKEALEWASRLRGSVTAVLVGSYARGDFNEWSDVDVVLVSGEFKGGPLERLKAIEVPPGYEVIPLTPEEFERLLERGDQLALEAVERGVKLRDDLGLLSRDFAEKARKSRPGTS
ncbi:DNA polymerase, beta domain protein region [Thermofilum pendens Hrk 5]|uniref:DNA polymerase, beta domain protein region n=1 Tax=Thermofilum pendens (strain DSM 2475 / Hrk 5) TaxID=368408 RepID=A1S0V1_THEPD|nr:DNA polymerase, beta domain protein region [Thermofilum pendens Hrk 5]